jgi:sigma-B regulation protein RsbU (phosphoserine phosphatase)
MKHALLGTLPGRAVVIGAVLKLVVALLRAAGFGSGLWTVFDTAGSVALVAAGLYLIVRGLAFAKQRLLWRVRRKLIISYIFIGFVPAILIVAFFLLGGLLLFSNFSSYLVQNRFQALADRAEAIAQTTAVELHTVTAQETSGVLERRQAEAQRDLAGASIEVLPTNRACSRDTRTGSPDAGQLVPVPPGPRAQTIRRPIVAGPWAHVDPPASIPEWIPCSGFKGLLAAAPGGQADPPSGSRGAAGLIASGIPVQVLVRAVRFAESETEAYAVVIDVPVGDAIIARLQRETGVSVTDVRSVPSEVRPLELRQPNEPASLSAAVPSQFGSADLPMASVAFLDYVDWETGRRAELRASIRMNVRETYNRIAAVEGGAGQYFGQGLLLMLVVIGMLFLVIEALALVAGLALARSITGSVHELFAGTERVRQGDFTNKIAIRARDQLGELAESFNSMTASIEDLLREQAEKRRLEEELRIAHEIQMSLLPQGPLGMPGVSVTALCVPAREVGGDYYDFLPLGDDRVGVLIADVSGKGTSAALYMAELKGLILSLSRIYASPRDLLITANRIIAEHLDARSFITITYAVLDLPRRTFTYARAGHTPLLYLPGGKPDGPPMRVLAPDGMVLGLKIDDGEMFERVLCEETMPVADGDLFLLFTDGITEAMNASDDCFGDLRLGRIIEEHGHLPSAELRERVLREIAAFVGDAPQHDDMTMILLRISGLDQVPAAASAVLATDGA